MEAVVKGAFVVTRVSTGRGNDGRVNVRAVHTTGHTNTSTVGLRACATSAVALSGSGVRFVTSSADI